MILIQLENGTNAFYVYFYFVLRPYFVAKKIGKTKNKKTDGLIDIHNTAFINVMLQPISPSFSLQAKNL